MEALLEERDLQGLALAAWWAWVEGRDEELAHPFAVFCFVVEEATLRFHLDQREDLLSSVQMKDPGGQLAAWDVLLDKERAEL